MKSKTLASFVWAGLIVYCSALMLLITLPYLSFKLDVDFLITKQRIIHLKHWRWAFYLHILTSFFVMLAGAVQFNSWILKKYKAWHRRVGKLYVYIILFLSGPAALVMSFYANGDRISRISFVLLSVLWITFTSIAFLQAIRGNLASHRQFMIRSYALTLSAITLRLYALIIPHFMYIEAKTEYALIAWASWTLNLLVAEAILFFTRHKQITA